MIKLGNEQGGTNRTLVILAVLILIMLVIIAVPGFKRFNYRSECIACEQAMKSAEDGLKIEYLFTFSEEDIKQARKSLAEIMPVREDICPKHGNVYLIRDENGIFEPVCGLHNPDAARRTRLNASYAGSVLEEARKRVLDKAKEGDPEPEMIKIKVNNEPLECVYVTEEPNIRRGTSLTRGYDGIVAFYGTDDSNDIDYFLYADENYCAVWHKGEQWRGSAYNNE